MYATLSTVIVAALVGTFIRWGIAGTLWGLLAVNAFGSFVAGWLGGLSGFNPTYLNALLVGFCGCLTTFSGFALVSVRLLEQGKIFEFAAHFILNNALCLGLCYGGWLIAKHT